MKKLISLILVVCILLAACSPAGDDPVIEITERFFVNQMAEILGNASRYLGRTIRLEGMFLTVDLPDGETFHMVYRLTDGCCGPIEPVGFEVHLDGMDPLPDDTWVEVTGILERYEHNSLMIWRLHATSLTEMSQRGAEFVTR